MMDSLTSQLGGLAINTSSPTRIVYLIGRNGNTASYFHWSSDKFYTSRCLSTPDSFEIGNLYCMRSSSSGAVFSELADGFSLQYTDRSRFAFSPEGYDKKILPSLLLGSRLRDHEQSCVVVTQRTPLILTAPYKPGFLEEVQFRAESGEIVAVLVTNKKKVGEKSMELYCSMPSTLPSSVQKGSRLQYCADDERIPIVTQALESFHASSLATPNKTLLSRIYGAPDAVAHSTVDRTLIKICKRSGADILLNAEQSEAVRRYQSDCTAFAVESPPGSGKTMTAAAMAVSYNGSGLQLFLSTANVPVFNMAIALAEIDYGDRKIIHLVSSKREATQKEHERSPFSTVNEEDEKLFRTIEGMLPVVDKKRRKELKDLMRWKREQAISAVGNCDVIMGTVDMILCNSLKKKDPKRLCPIQTQLEDRVRKIVIDEASQLTEAALNALILCFPSAQIVLIGDSKQLPPFKYARGETISEMAACSALEVLKRRRNVPVITQRQVYRAAPSLMKHYSDVFYGGELVSGKPESNRVQLTSIFRGITHRGVFINVKNSKTEQSGTSKINDEEIKALVYVVGKLRNAGYDHTSVMIIAYYATQRELAEQTLPDGYEVLTVDSAQGREKDIVIVLTTRDKPTTAEFFTCRLRCNVAMSRHKEALIVLGSNAFLETEPWKAVLDKKYFQHLAYGV